MRRLLVPVALVLSALAASWSWSNLEQIRAGQSTSAQVLYLPSGEYLKMVSLGFPELLADAIYIWSIQYYSDYEAEDRYEFLEHIFGNVISELDPLYVDPYLIGALIMSVEAKDDEMALRLLDKGIAAIPDEWILPFEAGFLCYNVLGDHARAARYFEKALAAPGVPPVVSRLRADMYHRMGDKRSSLGYWQEVYQEAETEYVENVAWQHVHDLTIEVHLEDLSRAIAAYTPSDGSYPPHLQALVGAGLLESLPADPEGRPYAYDRFSGEVRSQSPLKLRRRAGE